MPQVLVQRVEEKHPSDSLVDACANLLTELMKNDNCVLSLCGGESSLIFYMGRAMIRACAIDGEFYTAVNEENELLGYCLWMPPKKTIYSTDEQRSALDDYLRRLPEVGKEYYTNTYFKEFPTFVASCLGKEDWKDDFWWLHALMVRTKNQGQGVGRALIQPVRVKAAQACEPIAVSTTAEHNVPKYTGLGMRLLNSRTMPSPWGAFPLYVFSLDPRVSQRRVNASSSCT